MGPFSLRATAKMTGSMTISPASKKMGKPMMSEATPRAKGARFSPNRPMRASARDCAPPEFSTSRPSIAPKPTSRATDARVFPKPSVIVGTTNSKGMPAAKAVSAETLMRVINAWILKRMTMTRMTATAITAMPRRGPVDSVGSHVSMIQLSTKLIKQGDKSQCQLRTGAGVAPSSYEGKG